MVSILAEIIFVDGASCYGRSCGVLLVATSSFCVGHKGLRILVDSLV